MPRLLAIEHLNAAIENLLFGAPMARGQRLMGIEYERLILHRKTRANAPLSFCREMLADLVHLLDATPVEDEGILYRMTGSDFVVSMEPGGQLELATDPCPSVQAVGHIVARVTAVMNERLAKTPYELVCLGHAPVTPVAAIDLLPRHRYRIMDAEMPQRGTLSRNMMRATAGVQLAYDFVDRRDASRKMALMYRLAPVLLAITANSRMVEGKDSGYRSFRHRAVWETDWLRSRVPDGCLHLETAVDGYVRYARRAIMLFLMRDGRYVASPMRPLEDLVREGMVTEEDLALHLTSLFPLVRIRNYLEVRCFDCVEWPLAASVMALVSALMYCEGATRSAEAVSAPLAIDDQDRLGELHLAAARQGLDARVPGGPGFRDIAAELVESAAGTLGEGDCAWASRHELDTVRQHIAR